LLTLKLANALLYGVSIYAVHQPGRLDGKKQVALEKSQQSNDIFADSRSRTLIFPSGWAFAIWGVIFLGEFLFCTSSFFIQASSPVATVIRKASGGFMVGQIFQTLWTASFRPKYAARGNLVYISSAMLTGIAWSFGRAHAAFASSSTSYGLASYLLLFGPMSLHFGWTMAAALVNLNGNLATPANVSPRLLAAAGHLSAVVATGLGVFLSLSRRAPVVGAVISWALTACATGLGDRLEAAARTPNKASQRSPTAGLYGARVQKWLCVTGAVLSAAASVVTALPLRNTD
jgi:hypothetical protein